MRAIIIVIDSFGIGALPDAIKYGDSNANTALHICETIKGDKWTILKKLGLGNASLLLGNKLPGCEAVKNPLANFGVMSEKSPGKDTTTGHWELAGLELKSAFTTFPPEFPSFPEKLLEDFTRETGKEIIGNKWELGIEKCIQNTMCIAPGIISLAKRIYTGYKSSLLHGLIIDKSAEFKAW